MKALLLQDYSHPEFALVALVGFVFWIWAFFNWFKKPQIFLPKKYKVGSFSIFRLIFFVVGVVAWGYLAVALAGPRRPLGNQEDKVNVKDIYVVVDLSRSMLAEDMPPNRFESAKKQVHDFVNMFNLDRIGVIVFAEKVFTLLPLTTDTKIISKMVNSIQMGPLGDGTNIGDALALGTARLLESEAKSKIIVLLTDGVANVGTMTPLQAAELARDNKIKIYTIGIGGDENARIPIGGKNVFGVQRYQTIPGGSIDVKTMKEISEMTGGKSYLAKNNDALKKVLDEINRLERTEVIKRQGKVVYEELYYQYLLYAAVLFVFSEIGRRYLGRELV